MKTTLDLPDELVRRIKIRAVQEGRPLKDLVAELLTQAMDGPCSIRREAQSLPQELILTEDGFPILPCGGRKTEKKMTSAEWVAMVQEISEEEEIKGAGLLT